NKIMILLDTDHVSALKYAEHPRCILLKERLLRAAGESIATTIVTAEEQMRGWLARIHAIREPRRLVPLYRQLADLFEFFRLWRVVPFDNLAADHFDALLAKRIRVGRQDPCYLWFFHSFCHKAIHSDKLCYMRRETSRVVAVLFPRQLEAP